MGKWKKGKWTTGHTISYRRRRSKWKKGKWTTGHTISYRRRRQHQGGQTSTSRSRKKKTSLLQDRRQGWGRRRHKKWKKHSWHRQSRRRRGRRRWGHKKGKGGKKDH